MQTPDQHGAVHGCSFPVRDVNCDAHDSFYIESVSSILVQLWYIMVQYCIHDDDDKEECSLDQS